MLLDEVIAVDDEHAVPPEDGLHVARTGHIVFNYDDDAVK